MSINSMRNLVVASLVAFAAWAAFAVIAPASATTLTDGEQAIINVLKEYMPPDYVDGIVRRIEEVDARDDLNADQKIAEKKKILDRERKRAERAMLRAKADKDAGGISDPNRAALIYLILSLFNDTYLGRVDKEGEYDPIESMNDLPLDIRNKIAAEKKRIEDEREKKAKEGKTEAPAEPAPGSPPKSEGDVSFEGGFIAGRFDGPTQWYLATEPVLGTLVNGAFETGDDFWLYGGDFSVRYQPLGRQRFFELTFTYLEGDYSQDLGTFDAVGRGVGLPGTGDPAALFPNGVFFDAFGANNFDVMQNLRSTLDYRTIGGGFTGGHPAWSWNQLVVSPFAGIGVTRIDQRQTFGGDLPAYNVAFAYETDYDLMRYQGRLGSRIECTDPTKRLRASFEGAATFNWTDLGGDDRLAIAGPVSDSQSVSLDDDEFSVGYSGDFRLNYGLGALPLELQLGGWIEHGPAGATVFRSGQTGIPSEAEIKSATIYAGRIGIKYSF